MIGAFWAHGGVYLLGTLVTRGIGLILLPLYAHTLAPEQFGMLDLILAAGVLVNILVPLETPQALARFWNDRVGGAARRRLAGTALLFVSFAYAIFAAVGVALAPEFAALFTGTPSMASALRAGAVFIACNGVLLLLQSQFRWALRPKAFAASGACYSLAVLLGLSGIIATGQASVAAVLWAQAGAAAVVAGVCAWQLRDTFDLIVDRGELAAMLRFSLPLVPAGLAVFLTLQLHRFVLATEAPMDVVGHFGLAGRLAGIVTLVMVGVQQALTPLVYVHHAEPETPMRLARLLELFWALALMGCLALAACSSDLLSILATDSYVAAGPLVAWLAPAAVLAQMYVFSPGIPLGKKSLWQLGLTLGSSAFGLLCALLLVPPLQALGAAASSLLASAAFFVSWVVVGQKLYPLPVRWVRLVVASVGYAIAAALLPWLASSGEGALSWGGRLGVCAMFALLLWRTGLLHSAVRLASGSPGVEGR